MTAPIDMSGKTVLITGFTSGVGKAAALALAKLGADLVLLCRNAEKGRAVIHEIREQTDSPRIDMLVADLGSQEAIRRAAEEFKASRRPLHILFNNAGGGLGGRFPTETTEEWNRVINVNLNGTFYVSRAVWPHLVAAGGGAVVNMSSLAAQRGFSPQMYDEFGTAASSYYAAKAGVDALTRYMAGIGGKHNIRVNCVRPGQIMTPGATRGTINDPDGGHHVFEKMFEFAQIIPGPGHSDDVANLVLFLVSDESRFITAEIINIDGGVAAKI